MSAVVPITIVLATSGFLVTFMVFNFFTRVEPARVDLNFLRERNLYALHVLRVVESADYRFYSRESSQYRSYLFSSFAENLREDVVELSRMSLGGRAALYCWAFRCCYWILRGKNRIFASAGDLRVLLGIELMVVKRAAGA